MTISTRVAQKDHKCGCHYIKGYGKENGKHHLPLCENYATEKFPVLFYYEEGVNAWVPAPEKVDGELICIEDQLDEGEEMAIEFRRKDLTDKEYNELQEV